MTRLNLFFIVSLAVSVVSCEYPRGTDIFPLHPHLEAARTGDIKELKRLIEEEGVDVNKPIAMGGFGVSAGTFLEYASRGGQVEAVEYLISKGANDYLSALHFADNLEVVKIIIEYGGEGIPLESPLLSQIRNKDIALYLIEQGADVTYHDVSDGKTALHRGVYNGLAFVKILVEKGANVNARDKNNMTPLHNANSLEVVKYLVEKGANVNAVDNSGNTPLLNVISVANPEVAKYLIEQGADVTVKSKNYNSTPLYYAIEKGYISLARLIFEKGANPHIKTYSALTSNGKGGFYVEPSKGKTALELAKEKVGWLDFSLKKLIKDFETYTPSDDTK